MSVYTLTTLASFNGSNGSLPSGDLIADSAGNLYGTTEARGSVTTVGTVFEIVRATGALVSLTNFADDVAFHPVGGLIADSAGNLYGVTDDRRFVGYLDANLDEHGYIASGQVFELVKATGQVVILSSLDDRYYAGLPQAGLIADSAGNLFGTTGVGNTLNTAEAGTTSDIPAGGTVFEYALGDATARTLYTFPLSGSAGFNPAGELAVDSSGNIYGTTTAGGASNRGTVFELSVAGGASSLQTLVSFNGANGDYPVGRLILDGAGNLYGTTAQGGASGLGTVFEIQKTTGALVTLASFNGANGAGPDAGLTFDSAGHLFGTTSAGGAAGQGTVFEIVGGALQTIFTFNGANGSSPTGDLFIDAAGNLYGTTLFGGPSGDGTVFELSLAGNTPPTIGGAASNQPDTAGAGINPFSAVTVADPDAGQTETVTVTYASANGTLAGGGFVQTAPGVYTVSATSAGAAQADLRALIFTPVAGQSATTAFTLSVSDGQATATSGASVVAFAPTASMFSTLATFNGSNGGSPAGSLIADGAGNLYGVTSASGSNQGTVFEIVKSTGALQTLATFTGTNGSYPSGSLILDAAGNLYGTTSFGGASGQGNVFEIVQSTGALVTLASFSGSNGARPDAGLIADGAGNLYGTTELGGASNLGTVFEIVKSTGAVTTLASFGGANGSRPFAGLIADGAGNLYGTTAYGGASSVGTVFEIVKSTGALQTLASFSGSNGANPDAGLVADSAGNLYGTTYGGGASSVGTVFEVVKATGALQTLASFNTSNGARPTAGLIVDAAGDLFGTTNSGPSGLATVFEIVKNTGALQTLQTLQTLAPGSSQLGAASGLIADGAGTLYGTTSTGGATGGTVFALSPPAAQTGASVIAGANGGQATTDTGPIQPFAVLTVADPGATQETVTVTLSNAANGTLSGGGFTGGAASYSASFASAAAAQAGLRALVFTPTANEAVPGSAISTGFTVAINNGTATATDAATTVVATSLNDAPTLAGIAAAQTAVAGAAITPFASAVISDVDVGQTETVTVRYSASAGVFAGAGFSSGPNGATGTFASAAAAQAALRAATFTPIAGPSSVDTLSLTVLDAPGGGAAAAASTTVTASAPSASALPSAQAGLLTQFQNLERALASGADAAAAGSHLNAAFQVEAFIAAQLDRGQLTVAQADAALTHLVDGTTAVAVAEYGFFTGATPTAQGLNYIVHSSANATDLNDSYYQHFNVDNRYINLAVGLATGSGVGASSFAANYGGLSLTDATTKAYAAVFGTAAAPGKVDAILNTLVPDGLGGQETRQAYFAQYGGDGPNGLGTKAAVIGFLLDAAVHDGLTGYGAATEHYLDAIAHGSAPAAGSELVLTYGPDISLVGVTPVADPTVTG